MKLSRMTRRDFHKTTFLTAAGAAMVGEANAAPALPATDRIGIGLIGAGGMGTYNMKDFMGSGQVDVIAIADPYGPHRDEAIELTLGKAKGYKDFRSLLEHKDIEAVIVATPDHWHALAAILACDAGKDVYVEKPLSYSVFEGRRMVEAASRNKRIVQVGTQQRSGEHFQKAVELVSSGKIGKVCTAQVWLYGNSGPEGIFSPPDVEPPSWLDWDLWLGPAPYHAYNHNRAQATFRYFWDYAGGTMTDWGVHLLDVVHWAMGVEAPRTVTASGGKYVVNDNRETPDTFEVLYEYPQSKVSGNEFVVRWAHRSENTNTGDGRWYGIQFHGTEGTLFIDRGGYTLWPEEDRKDPWGLEAVRSSHVMQGDGTRQHYPHVVNFLDCLRTRKKPNSDIETAHRSTTAAHLGNIALRTGRKLHWDAAREQFLDDAEANRMLTRQYRKPWVLP